MHSFGQLLRKHRRQCRDPLHGGLLSQERLGELLGAEMGGTGYSSAAVSDWERSKSKIHADDRLLLVSLTAILHRFGGLLTPAEADALLQAGNYRALDPVELQKAFPNYSLEQAAQVAAQQEEATRTEVAGAVAFPATVGGRAARRRRKQLILLQKVRSFWVQGVLEQSIHGAALIPLTQRRASGEIDHPWQGVLGPVVHDAPIAPESQSPHDAFLTSDRALLILGEPGSGKTTSLIALAQDLVDRAERDLAEPVPVVLNLVSWVEHRQSLDGWLVEELAAKYFIPRQIGRKWLEDSDLLLLLDGFDEVPARFRARCAATINRFRETHGLTGLVVCSRTEEYADAGVPLKLGGAVVLQPLSSDQIDGYLAVAGHRLAGLRSAVQQDPSLQEMAKSPLLLSIMGQVYDDGRETLTGVAFEPSQASATMAAPRRRLFERYVQHMFQRRASERPYSKEQTTRWLAWLAHQMFRHNRSPFLVEQIQPSWLVGRMWRWGYILAVGLISGLFCGLIMWLLLQALRQTTPQLSADIARQASAYLQITEGRAEFFTLMTGNLLLGLLVALLHGFAFERLLTQDTERASSNRDLRARVAMTGLATGGLTAVAITLTGEPRIGLAWGLIEATIFMTMARYVYGRSYNSEIRTVESLSLSWPSALQGFVTGLALAAFFEVVGWLVTGELSITWTVVIPGAAGLILGGLRGRRLEVRSVPNQGILLSLRNSFFAGALSGLALAALGWTLRQPTYALFLGLLAFVITGALFGGANVIKHYLIRFLLWFQGEAPWNLVRFLDYAAALVLLRKVGGGYIFIHPLFQQYFASFQPPTQRPRGAEADWSAPIRGYRLDSNSA